MSALPHGRLAPAASLPIGERASTPWADRFALAAVVLPLLVGTGLRVLAARGPLWLDEIWSLALVAPLQSADQVFWAIPHDNNHLLNSLWLFLVGPDRSPLAERLPAVIFGALSIVAAARLGVRQNRATGVAAALLVAIGYPFVNYGSEARGYAGLLLAVLVGIGAFEAAMTARLAEPPRRAERPAWVLAAAMALGTLSHFTMLEAAVIFGMAALFRLLRTGRRWGAAAGDLVAIFGPSLVALLPIAAVVGFGLYRNGGLTIGGSVPFTTAHVLAGTGGLVAAILGLPASIGTAWLLAGTLVMLVAAHRLVRPETRILGLATLVLVAAMAVARLPNLEMPRYFLVPGVVLILFLAEIVGAGWQRGGVARLTALILLGACLLGHARQDARLLAVGRGDILATTVLMTREGATSYGSSAEFRAKLMVDSATRANGKRATLVSARDPGAFCAGLPRWYIDDESPDADPPSGLTVGPDACRTTYDTVAVFPSSSLSGRQWTLLRRAD